jgi:hypothetical protein
MVHLKGRSYLMRKGEVFGIWSKQSVLKLVCFAKPSVFYLEVRKMALIAKIKKVVAKWSNYAKSFEYFFSLSLNFNLPLLTHIDLS